MAAIDGAKVNFVYAQDSSHLPATLDANTVYFVPQSQTESGVLRVGSDIIATTDSSNIVITGSGSVVTGATWNNNTLTLTLGDVPAASASNAGLMSASDFSKLAGIATGAEANVQSNWDETTTTSDAYILNKPTALSDFTNDLAAATTSADGLMSATDKTKLNGITAGAEPNQNAYSKVTVIGKDSDGRRTTTNYNAITETDTFIEEFGNAFIFSNIAGQGVYTAHIDIRDATTTLHGAMSASDKTKLDGIATGAEANVQSNWNETTTTSDAYILNKPTALSDFTNDLAVATTTSDGLMSATDKADLDQAIDDIESLADEVAGIEPGAEVNQNAYSNVYVAGNDASGGTFTRTYSAASETDTFRETFTGAFVVSNTASQGVNVVNFDLRDASTTLHGAMSTSDKTKLDGISAGAEANVQSNWDETTTTSDAYILNKPTALSDFTNDLAVATSSADGLMSATDKSALDGAVSDISDIQDFITSDINPALEKLETVEEGAEPNQNAFSAVDLDYYDASGTHSSFSVAAQEPTDTYYEQYSDVFSLTVTGPKSSNTSIVNLDVRNATTTARGVMSALDKAKLDDIETNAEVNQNAFSYVSVSGQSLIEADAKTDTLTLVAGSNVTITTDATNDSITISAASAPAAPVTSVNTQTGDVVLDADDVGAIASSLKGANSGVAELDATGKVPTSQLPSFVDDVLEYATRSAFPATGETGKIYVDLSTNLTYRWGGTEYVEISPSLALGTTSSTAFRGDYGNTAYTHATDSSRLTTATASGLYKVASTAEGHIASLTAVAKSDITALGIPAQDTTYSVASASADGLMSSSDYTKLSGITSGAEPNVQANWNETTTTSDAYILNKPTALSDFTNDLADATTTTSGLMSASDKTKLNGIATGAEENQNAFGVLTTTGKDSSGSAYTRTYTAGSETATFYIQTGDGIAMSAPSIQGASGVRLTLNIPDATSSASGLMSATDKSDLDQAVSDISDLADEVAAIEPGAQVNTNNLTDLVVTEDGVTKQTITFGDATDLQLGVNSPLFIDTIYSGSSGTTVGFEIGTNAEVNQYAMSNVVVGSTTISASSKTDTLTLVAGSNVTLTPNTSNKSVTITSAVPTWTVV